MPHVLYVNHTSAPNPLIGPLVRALHPHRVRFTYCSLDAGGPVIEELASAGVESFCLRSPDLRQVGAAAWKLARLVRRLEVDVVHSNLFAPAAATAAAQVIGFHRTPVVLTRHHDRSHHVAGKMRHVAVDSWVARRAQHVIVPTTPVLRTLVDLEGVPAADVSVVHHGLEWDQVLSAAAGAERWRARFGAEALAVAVGRYDELKDYETLFRAVAAARVSAPRLQLAIAGAAGEDARAALMSLAARVGLVDGVHVVGHISDVHALIASADVFVQASRAESFGLAVLEALGLGVPLAVTTPGGVREIVQPWYPDLDPGDAPALVERILDAVRDPVRAREHAATAASATKARFTSERMAAGHAAIYDRVLRARHAPVG